MSYVEGFHDLLDNIQLYSELHLIVNNCEEQMNILKYNKQTA